MSAVNENNGVLVEPFVEAFQKSGLTATEVARRAGHMRPAIGDGNWTKHRLGLKAESHGNGLVPKRTPWITRKVAEQLCEAMGLDPVEMGL